MSSRALKQTPAKHLAPGVTLEVAPTLVATLVALGVTTLVATLVALGVATLVALGVAQKSHQTLRRPAQQPNTPTLLQTLITYLRGWAMSWPRTFNLHHQPQLSVDSRQFVFPTSLLEETRNPSTAATFRGNKSVSNFSQRIKSRTMQDYPCFKVATLYHPNGKRPLNTWCRSQNF